MLSTKKTSLFLAFMVCQSFLLFTPALVFSSEIEACEASPPSSLGSNFFNIDDLTEDDFKNAEEVSSGFSCAPSEAVLSDYLFEAGLDLTTKGVIQKYGDNHDPCFGLSIDGGGVRGVMPALWLQDLEAAYADSEEGIGEPLHKLFDYVGGTSIGGIISLGVAEGLELGTILDLFKNHRSEIFASEGRRLARFRDFFGLLGPRYSAKPLEALLQETFHDRRLSGLKTNVLVTACTTDGHPWLFKRNNQENCRLWEVARCTSAAPVYFEGYKPQFPVSPVHPTLVDGGIWANNPACLVTASIVNECHEGDFEPEKLHILSLGTGDTNNQPLPKRSGVVAAGAIIEALMSSHSRGNHMLMRQLLGDQYCRVNAEMDQAIDLADTSQRAYEKMEEYARREVHQDKIKAFVEQTAGLLRTKLERD